MKNFLTLTLIVMCTFRNFSQSEQVTTIGEYDKTDKLLVGEDLTYVVKYAFFNLGEIRFNVVEKTRLKDTCVYKTVAYIDSYPDLPFVNIHQVYESYIDSSSLLPLKFFAQIFGEDTILVNYDFIGDSIVQMQKAISGGRKIWFDSTAIIHQPVQDGLSILYFVRSSFGKEQTIHFPCFVNEGEETTTISFYNEPEPASIEAVEYEIDCLYLDGYTDFVSVYGMTGNFEGWFSNDKYAVPIRAKLNVIIGSVDLELIKWNSELWNPPLYKN